jgi:hypothetical protein
MTGTDALPGEELQRIPVIGGCPSSSVKAKDEPFESCE